MSSPQTPAVRQGNVGGPRLGRVWVVGGSRAGRGRGPRQKQTTNNQQTKRTLAGASTSTSSASTAAAVVVAPSSSILSLSGIKHPLLWGLVGLLGNVFEGRAEGFAGIECGRLHGCRMKPRLSHET
eukprot:9488973-Pyramimonas_sp.AAC.1